MQQRREEEDSYRVLETIEGMQKIRYGDILYIQKAKGKKYVEYYTQDKVYREQINMKTLWEELQHRDFVYADRSCLVNIEKVIQIHGMELELSGGVRIRIARRHLMELKECVRLQYGRGRKGIMGYRSIIIILAVLEALMSAYLMKQGMPATAGRKADRFIYAGSVGTVVLLVAGKEYPIGMYLTVFLLTLCGFICVALGTEAYAFAFGVPAVCYGGLSFLEVFIASWAVLMQGTSQNPSKMWKLDMLPKTVSCLIAGVIFLGYVCFICKKKTIKRIAEEYKGLIVTFGAGLHIVILIYQLMLMGEGTKWYFQNIVTANVIALLLIWLLWQFSKFIFRYESLQRENQMIEFQNTMMENNYANLKEALEENRRINHDMKNHLLLLKEYEKRQDWKELRSYLDKITPEYQSVKFYPWTTCQPLDLLLNLKMHMAEKKKIVWKITACSLEKFVLEENEICILFGNLLDNALEASEKVEKGEKWIKTEIQNPRNMLFINIANSMEKQPVREGKRWISQKENQKFHGYGLISVERIVEKYEGTIRYLVTKDRFEVQVSFFMS